MKNPVQALTAQLARRHGCEGAVPTGNATSALYLIFKSLGLRDGDIAIPNNVCVNVPIAVLLSGNRPVFVDVDESDLGLSPARLEERTELLAAVVGVHAYGVPCRMDQLAAYCRRKGIPLIEDFALSQGAVVGSRPVGCLGDVSCVSFGAGKIISVGGGGAVLSRDSRLLDEVRRQEALMPAASESRSDRVDGLLKAFRTLYNEWVGRDLNGFWREWRARVDAEGSQFLCRFPEALAPAIGDKLAVLDDLVAGRRHRAEVLRSLLKSVGSDVTPLILPEGSVYWRLNLLVREGRNDLLKSLLEKRFRISSWYGSTDLFFRPRSERTGTYEVSDRIGATILNLWVNDEVDDAYAPAIAGEIGRLMAVRRQGV